MTGDISTGGEGAAGISIKGGGVFTVGGPLILLVGDPATASAATAAWS
ncbi:hypothetical protein [Actinoallomurus sp. CA-142502]